MRSTRWAQDFRGDPSSALLEVLDPEQNATFNDHYLEVDYDLSNVMFVTTANTLNIPAPLMDRMEVIRIAGYTEDEKAEIARTHLMPHALRKHGLEQSEFSIDNDGLMLLIVATRGKRESEPRARAVQPRAEAAVKAILTTEQKTITVTADNIAITSVCRSSVTARPKPRIRSGW